MANCAGGVRQHQPELPSLLGHHCCSGVGSAQTACGEQNSKPWHAHPGEGKHFGQTKLMEDDVLKTLCSVYGISL